MSLSAWVFIIFVQSRMNKAKKRWVDNVTVFSVLCNQSTLCFRIQIGVIDGKKHADCIQKSNPGDKNKCHSSAEAV